jgi:ParB-like chromosome segregation protein Spo0J
MSDTAIIKRYSKQAILIPIAQIVIGTDRIRGEDEFGNLQELADSIRDEGLLHPPVINADNLLIVGERRIRAMRDILKWTEIPVMFLETLDAAHVARLENDENFKRHNAPSWKMRIRSIAKQHSRMALQNALLSQKWGQTETGKLLGMSQANVAIALKVNEYLEKKDPEITKAESMADAIRVLAQRAEDARNKLLVAMTSKPGHPNGLDILNVVLGSGPTNVGAVKDKTAEELDAEMFGDAKPSVEGGVFQSAVKGLTIDTDEMPSTTQVVANSSVIIPLTSMFSHLDGAHDLVRRGPNCTDHIICDLPFGIEDHMDTIMQSNGGQDITQTRAGHDPQSNIDFVKRLIPVAFDAIRDNGFFIGFYDLEHHGWIMELGAKSGFKVCAWPIIWSKTHRCSNKAAGFNFTKSHETAFVFRKGNATLLQPQDRSVWTGSNEVEAKALGHPFAKPFKLWQWIYSAVAQRGQTVYDPCVGRGSSTIAALEYGLRPMGAELIEADYNALIINAQNWYKIKDKSVQFS